MGAGHHLRPPPIVAVSDSHLDPALCGSRRPPRTRHSRARDQHHRHVHRTGTGGARTEWRGARARDVRRLLPGLHRLHACLPEHPRLVDRDAGRQLRDDADDIGGRPPGRVQGPAPVGSLPVALDRGKVEPPRRRQHDGHGVNRHAPLRRQVRRGRPLQSLSERTRPDTRI